MQPIKALEYELLVEVRRINTDDDQWETVHEFEQAYTAADAVTQVELRYKHNDQFEKGIVTNVRPANRKR